MQVSIETKQGLERCATIKIPSQDLKQAVNKKIQEYARQAHVNGFRPGKVPVKIVRQRFGQKLEHEAQMDMVQSSFSDVMRQENIYPVMQPLVNIVGQTEDDFFTYQATFEVFPEFKLADLKEESIVQPVVEITSDDLDKMIDSLRQQRLIWDAVERPAQKDDKITFDLAGTIDGEPFDGGVAKDIPLVLGEGRMIDGFEEKLQGASIGETVVMDLTFPEDYHKKDVAGKAVHFEVTVNLIEQAVKPEVDAEFIRDFGVDSGELDDFHHEIKQNMQRELDQKLHQIMKDKIFDLLLEKNPIDLPKSLIASEAKKLYDEAQQRNQQEVSLPKELFESQAKRRIHLGLVFAELMKQYQLEPDPEKVEQKIDQMVASYEEPELLKQMYYQNKEQLEIIEQIVLEDQMMAIIQSQLTLVETPQTFSEIMNPNGETE